MQDAESLEVDWQRELDNYRLFLWVDQLARWDVIAHLTFRWEVSLDSARRGYEKFMRRSLPGVSYFYAEEENPCRDGYHVHALWADARRVYRREAWAAWFDRFGRARIEPVTGQQAVSNYCAKYVTKEGAWWNFYLQWHRLQDARVAREVRPFTLESDPPAVPVRLPAASVDPPAMPLPTFHPEFQFSSEVFNLVSPGQVEGVRWTNDGSGVFRPCSD